MPLTDIATINVTSTSAGVTRPGFGVPAICSFTANWQERVRFYSNLAAVAVDFAVNSAEYRAAQAIFSQPIQVTQIAILRMANKPTKTVLIGVQTVGLGLDYKIRAGTPTGTVYSTQDADYNSGGGATVWSPSGVWSRGDLIVNPPATGIGNLFSCLGPSGALGAQGLTGYGGASGPVGATSSYRDNGVYWAYVGTGNTGSITNDAIVVGLDSKIRALGAPTFVGTGANQISTSLSGTPLSLKLQLLANQAGQYFGYKIYSRTALNGTETQADPGVAADLLACNNENSNWYGLASPFGSQAVNDAIATWAESNTKLFPASSSDTQVPTVALSIATDVGHDFVAAAYARSWLFWHPASDDFANAAELGRFLPLQPGSETWRMKTLAGITAENYTQTEINNLKAKYAHFYYTIGGVNVVGGDAKSAANEYVDVVRFLDWYTANLQGDLADLFIGNDKIPYTNGGIDQIEAVIRARNAAGIAVGGITPGSATVTAPDVADVTAANKAARELSGVQSSFTLAGAIHHITVNVTASQ